MYSYKVQSQSEYKIIAEIWCRIFLQILLISSGEFHLELHLEFHLELRDEYEAVTEVRRIFHPPTHNEGHDKGQESPISRCDIPGPVWRRSCRTPAVPGGPVPNGGAINRHMGVNNVAISQRVRTGRHRTTPSTRLDG